MNLEQVQQPPKANENGWQIDKRISVGHLLTALVMALSAVTYANTFDKRIDQNSMAIEYLKRDQTKTEIRQNDFQKEMRDSLKTVDNKLDRIIESKG